MRSKVAAVQVKHAENKQLQNKHPAAEKETEKSQEFIRENFAKVQPIKPSWNYCQHLLHNHRRRLMV